MLVKNIPINEIHADEDFNCRGVIAPIDVVNLAKDIQMNGLQNPLVVHPYDEEHQKKTGFPYRLVSGYRRQKAAILLEWKEIPCNVLGEISDIQARIMNLGENLNREDLNILQEAKAIEHLKNAGLTETDVAKQLNQSRGWVQVRYMLLSLPKEIQKEASAGVFNQQQIRDLYSLGARDRQIAAALEIKERKERGEKSPEIIKKAKNPFLKKRRERNDIFQMIDHIQDSIGSNIGTRCLAWAAGEITDRDLYKDISELAKEKGINYAIPETMLPAVS